MHALELDNQCLVVLSCINRRELHETVTEQRVV